MVDDAADELGIDPVELRRRNIIPPEAMPFKSGLTFTYDCGEFARESRHGAAAGQADGFERRRAEAGARGKLRGLGISNTIERAAAGGYEAAEVRFDRSGTVTLVSGSITQGQGHETVYKQIAVRPARHRPRTRALRSGRHRQGRESARAPAARARPHSAGRRSIWPPKRSCQGQGDRRPPARRRGRRGQFRRRSFYRAAGQPRADGGRGRGRIAQSAQACPTAWSPG